MTGRSPRSVRGIYIANLIAQMAIIVTGAIVRITASGLGCPTWPECVDGSITPTSAQAEAWHKYIEFGNRLLTFALVVLALAAILAAGAVLLCAMMAVVCGILIFLPKLLLLF